MDALMEYAKNTSAPPSNDYFDIIWRQVPLENKQWIAQGLVDRYFANEIRLKMMRKDYGPNFMPAPPPPWESAYLSAPGAVSAAACMQTSARPNPYIVQALNR